MTAIDRNVVQPSDLQTAELSVILPTFNEAANVRATIGALAVALEGVAWEVILVDDDSSDGTWRIAQEMARLDPRVRCLRRVGRRGLASAAIEGMLASSAPFLAVMDADGQHDESKLPAMLTILRTDDAEMVVGSRYVDGGIADGLAGGSRRALSRWGTRVTHWLYGGGLSDPMSGFFMLRRSLLERAVYSLSGIGFKILLDLVLSAKPPPRITEVPFIFRRRGGGDSKLGAKVLMEFVLLLVDKFVGGRIPVHFFKFGLIGTLGALVHVGVLGALYISAMASFEWAQATATLVAMTFNFVLNNNFTYRDRKLKGTRMLWGLAEWYLACSVGAVTNQALSTMLFGYSVPWLLAGLIGSVVAAIWNFSVTKSFSWSIARAAPGTGRRL